MIVSKLANVEEFFDHLEIKKNQVWMKSLLYCIVNLLDQAHLT
jgi:hypothetical protein